MEAWAWLLAYVLGFGLLQLLLYRYFQGKRDHAGTSPEPTDGSGTTGVEGVPDDGRGGDAGEIVACDNCGAANERHPNFDYCRECASPLH